MIVDPDVKLYDSVTANRSGRDEEEAKFYIGQKVKLLADIVNDGTYPHSKIGAVMMKKDSIGYVKTVGEFLQVIRVYEVHFLGTDAEIEIVGCREHELEAMEDVSAHRNAVAEEQRLLQEHHDRMNNK